MGAYHSKCEKPPHRTTCIFCVNVMRLIIVRISSKKKKNAFSILSYVDIILSF